MKKKAMFKMYWRKEKLEPQFFTEDPSTAGCGKISTRDVT